MSVDAPPAAAVRPGDGARPRPGKVPTVFLSAGEPSGDEHGGRLAAELRRRRPGWRLAGLGGGRMAAEGVELLADLDRLAVLGFAEVVGRLPSFLRLRREVRRFLRDEGVDLVVPIDYPGFNLPLARHAHRHGIRVLYYVVPQVWAWHAARARALGAYADRVCAILPFEPGFLARFGTEAEFVGHPLLDAREPAAEGVGAPEAVAAADGRPVLGLFPGSRAQEVQRILPLFLEAAARLRRGTRGLRVLVARVPHLSAALYGAAAEVDLATAGEVTHLATAALAKSGTVTLQLAVAGVPMVVGYRVSPLTWQVARRLVRVEHVALVNLVAGERIVPELLQSELTPERLARLAAPLLRPGDTTRERMVAGLARVRAGLGEPGCTGRVATRCLELLETGAGVGRRGG